MAPTLLFGKVSGDTSAFSLDAGTGVLSLQIFSPIMNPNLNNIEVRVFDQGGYADRFSIDLQDEAKHLSSSKYGN